MSGLAITYFDDFQGPNKYAFLSNFYVGDPLIVRGRSYMTGEHFFQACKACNWGDHDKVMNASNPSDAKYTGRTITLRPDWESVKFDVMRVTLALKFTYTSDLSDRLLATGSHLLVEGNTWNDRVWGAVNGRGRNWLGTLLMARRAELASGDDVDSYTLASLTKQAFFWLD